MGHGDGVDGVQFEACFCQCLLDHRTDRADVRPGRQLGHDAAVRCMVLLRQHHIGQQVAISRENGCGRLVTGRLDAEDDQESAGDDGDACWDNPANLV